MEKKNRISLEAKENALDGERKKPYDKSIQNRSKKKFKKKIR